MVLAYPALSGGMDEAARVHRGAGRSGRVAAGVALPIGVPEPFLLSSSHAR
jgi:hypothetical protein